MNTGEVGRRLELGSAPVRVGLVGLGYWGPNLLRVLSGMANVRVAWICDLDADRLDHFQRLYPSVRATADPEDLFGDPRLDAVLIATPVFTHFDLASRSLAAGKHTFVEKPLAASSEDADELLELADRARARPDVRTHLPLQPPRAGGQGAARRRGAGRGLLHLLEPGQPRPSPAGRERDLGPRPPRLLDPALLARRDAVVGLGGGARLGRRGHPRRRLRHAQVPLRDARERRDELARPEQAAAHGDRRQQEDGRLRRRRHRAGEDLRPRRRLRGPDDVRRVPALLPHRRHRLAAPGQRGAARRPARGLRQRREHRDPAARSR